MDRRPTFTWNSTTIEVDVRILSGLFRRVIAVHTFESEGRDVPYLLNPTKSEFDGFFNKVKKMYREHSMDSNFPMVRGLVDRQGNLYVTDPFTVTHSDFARGLGFLKSSAESFSFKSAGVLALFMEPWAVRLGYRDDSDDPDVQKIVSKCKVLHHIYGDHVEV